jgi:hypothetical protein
MTTALLILLTSTKASHIDIDFCPNI